MIYKDMALPDGLDPVVEGFVKAVIDELSDNGRLTPTDACSLYLLACSYQTFMESRELAASSGLVAVSDKGNRSVDPAAKLMRDSLTSCLRILQEIGGTQRAKKSLKALDQAGGGEDSPLVRFMRSGGLGQD